MGWVPAGFAGVQDMACDTFIKISQKCRKQFVMYQPGEVQPFIEEILKNMPTIIRDLKPHQACAARVMFAGRRCGAG